MTVVNNEEKIIDLNIRVRVLDEGIFKKSAQEYYHRAWGNDLQTEDLGEVALELIALSNLNPSPLDLGFEFVNHSATIAKKSEDFYPRDKTATVKLKCQNCDFQAPRTSFVAAKDLLLRVEPGDPFTDSECPKCGALAYPDNEVDLEAMRVMELFLRKLYEYTSNLSKDEAFHDLSKLAMHLSMLAPEEAISYAQEVLSQD